MSEERDIEKEVEPKYFASTLRRIADAVEAGKPFRIQVGGQRLTVPVGATLGIAHEHSDGEHELELEFTWEGGDAKDDDDEDDDD